MKRALLGFALLLTSILSYAQVDQQAGSANTLNDLKSRIGNKDGYQVKVGGNTTLGDGGGSVWRWDATSIETPVTNKIVQVTGVATGRWKIVTQTQVGITGLQDSLDASTLQRSIDRGNTLNKASTIKGTGVSLNINVDSLLIQQKLYLPALKSTKKKLLTVETDGRVLTTDTLIGGGGIDTMPLHNQISVLNQTKLNATDTSSLSNRINAKLNTKDTVTLSNRINAKLNTSDTLSLSTRINSKLNTKDTASLSSRIDTKLNTKDTASLSNRINTKLSASDTLSLSSRINTKLEGKDTSSLSSRIDTKISGKDTVSLSNRINTKLGSSDTLSLSSRINTKLNLKDTITLSNRIDGKLNPQDTISLSSRINTKLNSIDTASLSNRINAKLNTKDTASLSTRINTKLNTSDSIVKYVTPTQLKNYSGSGGTAIDTTSLSNRINTKLNATDTASLSNRIDAVKFTGATVNGRYVMYVSKETNLTTADVPVNSQVAFATNTGRRFQWDSTSRASVDQNTYAIVGKSVGRWLLSAYNISDVNALPDSLAAQNLARILAKGNELINPSTIIADTSLQFSTPHLSIIDGTGGGGSKTMYGVISSNNMIPNTIDGTTLTANTAAKLGWPLSRVASTSGQTAVYSKAVTLCAQITLNIKNYATDGTQNFTSDVDRPAYVTTVNDFFRNTLVPSKTPLVVVGNEETNLGYMAIDTTAGVNNSARRYYFNEAKVVDSIRKKVAPTVKIANGGFPGQVMFWLVYKDLRDQNRTADATEFKTAIWSSGTSENNLLKWDTDGSSHQLSITYERQLLALYLTNQVAFDYFNVHIKYPLNGVDQQHVDPNVIKWTVQYFQKLLGKPVICNELGSKSINPTITAELLQYCSDYGMPYVVWFDGVGYSTDPVSGGLDIALRSQSDYQSLNDIGTGARDRVQDLKSTLQEIFRTYNGKVYLPSTALGSRKLLTLEADSSIGTTDFSSGNGTSSGYAIDTTALHLIGQIKNIDSVGIQTGDYVFTGKTRGVLPANATGTVILRTVDGSPVFDGSIAATMLAQDRFGNTYARGYNVNAPAGWGVWQQLGGSGGSTDPSTLLYYNGALNNLDSIGALKTGVYTYNNSVTGVKASGMTLGNLFFTSNNGNTWNGTSNASMFAINNNGLTWTRGFNGVRWSNWLALGGSGGIDTTNIVYLRSNILNFDTVSVANSGLSIPAGDYTYSVTTRGVRPVGTNFGTLTLRTTSGSPIFDGNEAATMQLIDKGNGLIYTRGYTGSVWGSWKTYSTNLNVTDTTNILYLRGSIINVDTISAQNSGLSIAVGDYTYNVATRGIKPTGATIGVVSLRTTSGSNVFDGNEAAVMTMVDKGNGNIYTRGYTGSVWGSWKSYPVATDTSNIIYYHGSLGNLDSSSLSSGWYSYTTTVTGAKAAGMTFGQVLFSASTNRDWTGAKIASMFAINQDGKIFWRGYNGSSWSAGNWGAWQTVQNIDTSNNVYYRGKIANFDAMNGLLMGEYYYNSTTTGTHPGSPVSFGTVSLKSATGQKIFDATQAATMTAVDRNSGQLFVRTFNTTKWLPWVRMADTTEVLRLNGTLVNIDSIGFLQGQAVYNDSTTRGTMPPNSHYGMLLVLQGNKNSIIDSAVSYSQLAIDKVTGRQYTRAFNKSTHTLGDWNTVAFLSDINSNGSTGGSDGDSVFLASPAAGITTTQISNWNTAFSWGNHATQGYLKDITGKIVAGSNVTVTGSGTTAAPYVINSTASGTTYSGNGFLKLSGTTPSYISLLTNSDLLNHSININGTDVPLGGSITIGTTGTRVSTSVTSSAYTVASNISVVFVNFGTAESIITMPNANVNLDREITIRNLNNVQPVGVANIGDGSGLNMYVDMLNGVTLHSNGIQWIPVANFYVVNQ